MSVTSLRIALAKRVVASIGRASQVRLGIGATLSIAFVAVAILAAAANLISERGLQIVRTTRVPAPVERVRVVREAPVAVIAPEPEAEVLPAVSSDVLLTAIARHYQSVQGRSGIEDDASLLELQKSSDAMQSAADELLRNVRDRSSSQERRRLTNGFQDYRTTAASLIQAADEQRALINEYSARYDAMHDRSRASIDNAWKVFGRVVARQVLVTLNRQVEDLGRHSAALIARSVDTDMVAASIASSEASIAATLTENERGLSGSQGKDWIAAMRSDLVWLIAARERLMQMEEAQRGLRERLTKARNAIDTGSKSIVVVRATPKITQELKQPKPAAAASSSAHSTSSARGHHALSPPRISTVTTTVPDDAARKSLVAWISVGVLLVLILICVATVRSVVGPVKRLVRASSRLADGELDARVPAGGFKELDTLATAFNNMADRLAQAERITRDYQAELEAEVQQRTDELRQLASHDPLTSLPNRRELFALLNAALEQADRTDGRVGVFFLDMDNFKTINDGMGHAFGDRVLLAMAQRLQAVAKEFGFAARLGGDEFTVVMTNAGTLADVQKAGSLLVDAFAEPLTVGARDLVVSVSVGASVFPDHEREADALLRAADAAVFKAKALGRSQLTMYSPELLASAAAKFSIEQGLRHALDNAEFELVFQPELSLASMQVDLVEALIRWRQPDGRLATPGEFLAVAEESGLIMEISDWVLQSAIATAAQWHHGSWPGACVAINVSSRQLIDATFVDRVRQLLREYRLPARCIEIELTESVLQTGPVTLESLRQLRAHGIAIALDDFGTGYSSLSSLQQLPLTRIKLDRSLIDDIDTSPRTRSIARSIISLARSLRLNITVEGIERAEQLALLLEEGDLCVQGYLLSRPLREEDLIPSLESVPERAQEILLPSTAPRITQPLTNSTVPVASTINQ
jgi:diguanylate cyclase (GGDEF)-like protein